jgi:hypothetical protein
MPASFPGRPGSMLGQSTWVDTDTGSSPKCFSFSLSVKFRQCSIVIHLSIIDAILYKRTK